MRLKKKRTDHAPEGGLHAYTVPVLPPFAARLRAEKARLGLTCPQLAELLGASPRTVSHWLAGTRVPLQVTQEGVFQRISLL